MAQLSTPDNVTIHLLQLAQEIQRLSAKSGPWLSLVDFFVASRVYEMYLSVAGWKDNSLFAVSLSRQWHDILDFSNCPLSRVLHVTLANEWFASNPIPCYAQWTLGSPGGKHRQSLKGNVWRKAVSTSKKGILRRDQYFLAVVLSQMDLGNVERRKM